MGINAQVTELRSTYDTLQSEVDAVSQRVLDKLAEMDAKIMSLGEEDPDLSADIQEVRDDITKLQGIAATESAPEEPIEPAPIEP
jgi:uncharacterized protein involved in exopolysaccharide biosynthesis